MTVRKMEKTEKIISELRSVRKLTSPSMKMPRSTPRTVFSGWEALCFFMGNCATASQRASPLGFAFGLRPTLNRVANCDCLLGRLACFDLGLDVLVARCLR
jgi:hypothetical protein